MRSETRSFEQAKRYSCIFLISFSAIYLQIALIRSLSAIYYGALTYFIISLALLGFGASGTFLAFFRKKLTKYPGNIVIFLFLYLISIIFSLFITAKLPLNLLYIFYDARQILNLSIFSLLFFLPFFFSGLIIGYILINENNKELFYGINLLGSGAGGLFALGSMYFIDPVSMPFFVLFPIVTVIVLFILKRGNSLSMFFLIPLIIVTVLLTIYLPRSEPDQYKDIYQYQLLEKQGDARLISTALSPNGKIEAWSSPSGHSTLFAGLENEISAPPQLTLFNDGNFLSQLFQIQSAEEAGILDNTIQSLPYRIIDNARVLLVGDSGLINAWLALRYNPESVTVLLPDKSVKKFLEENLRIWTDPLLKNKKIKIIADDYRHFFMKNKNSFDIIHFASAESLTGSMSGLYTFQEDYSLTVEAIISAWFSLSERGVLSLSRGNQIPSKDNLKILLTLYKSGETLNLTEPEKHIFQVSNYLATISLFARKEFNQKLTDELNLHIEHTPGDPIHYENLINNWIYDIRPSEDGRPFFNSFFRWKSLKDFYQLYGPYWFRQSDLGYLILLITLILIIAFAFIFILLPHILGKSSFQNPFLFFFPLIGLAFMFVEMVFIQKMSLFLGHSSISVSLVLSVLLIFSGLGSIAIKKISYSLKIKLFIAVAAISLMSLLLLIFSDQIIKLNSMFSNITGLFMLIICSVTGFFMGWFFAPALSHLEKKDKKSLPMAWALNGFASVAASPLAVLLSISLGFIVPVFCAILLYTIAYIIFYRSLS